MKAIRSSSVTLITLLSALATTAWAGDTLMTSIAIGQQSSSPLCPGSSASYPITIYRSGNGNMEIDLSTAGLPTGTIATFSPSPVLITGNNPSGTTTLTLSTSSGTLPGVNSFKLIAIDGSSHNTLTNTIALSMTMCSPGISRAVDGGICLSFAGVTNESCSIEATTNLAAPVWVTLCSTNFGTNTLVTIMDMDATNYPARFYRTKMP